MCWLHLLMVIIEPTSNPRAIHQLAAMQRYYDVSTFIDLLQAGKIMSSYAQSGGYNAKYQLTVTEQDATVCRQMIERIVGSTSNVKNLIQQKVPSAHRAKVDAIYVWACGFVHGHRHPDTTQSRATAAAHKKYLISNFRV